MASQFDESDFVDGDFHAAQKTTSLAMDPAAMARRPPTREELDTKVGEAQQRLAELKRAQEELERERAVLEEARRRRVEFQTGRAEMLQHLTRGVGLLEEGEFGARREAEQMAKSLRGLREALEKVQSTREESWSQEDWDMELTRALTAIENARLEWNGARLKWPVLNGQIDSSAGEQKPASFGLDQRSFLQLCRIGLALTWPVAVVALIGCATIILLLVRR